MTDGRHAPPALLPTLTEVLAPELESRALAHGAATAARPDGELEAAISAAVLDSLQSRIDLMFELRLREAVAPALARAADTLIHDLRDELAQSLRELVACAVAQEIERRGGF